MNKKINEKLEEFKRTKSITVAVEICELLLEGEENERRQKEASGRSSAHK